MGLDNLKEDVLSAIDTLKDGISANPLGAVAVAGGTGVVLGGTVGAGVVAATKRRKKKSKSKNSRKKRSRSRSRKRRKGRRTPRTAGKGKDRSTKRIRYTKNGQPYVITRSGKAKFISKKGAKASRKRKGGRY